MIIKAAAIKPSPSNRRIKPVKGLKISDRLKIYRDREGARIVHFMYSDGARVTVARPWAENQVCQGKAIYIDTDEVAK